jgi:hypothetical protein
MIEEICRTMVLSWTKARVSPGDFAPIFRRPKSKQTARDHEAFFRALAQRK